jgi:hypothetical protein
MRKKERERQYSSSMHIMNKGLGNSRRIEGLNCTYIDDSSSLFSSTPFMKLMAHIKGQAHTRVVSSSNTEIPELFRTHSRALA